MKKTLTAILFLLCAAITPVKADETAAQLPSLPATPVTAGEPAPQASFLSRAASSVESTIDRALDFIGLRYKRGGSSPETGFDCSGFVRYVYNETLGLVLPHNAKAIAQQGELVEKAELQPGDLVFFNTMRRAFSHVGIYLGDNLFIHAPRSGARVRIEDMTDRYWSRRYNGARRIRP
ncbi:MAG: C40 family peptidase [Rhodocyclaceae bacterium]